MSDEIAVYVMGVKDVILEMEKIMPNADNSNPCMKCGSVQCARCGFDMLKEFEKIKKKFKYIESNSE